MFCFLIYGVSCMIIFCRSELPNKELKESFNICCFLVPDALRRSTPCMNNKLYCLNDHTLVTTGTQCGALIFMHQWMSARSIQHSGSLWVQGCLHRNHVQLTDKYPLQVGMCVLSYLEMLTQGGTQRLFHHLGR